MKAYPVITKKVAFDVYYLGEYLGTFDAFYQIKEYLDSKFSDKYYSMREGDIEIKAKEVK